MRLIFRENVRLTRIKFISSAYIEGREVSVGGGGGGVGAQAPGREGGLRHEQRVDGIYDRDSSRRIWPLWHASADISTLLAATYIER